MNYFETTKRLRPHGAPPARPPEVSNEEGAKHGAEKGNDVPRAPSMFAKFLKAFRTPSIEGSGRKNINKSRKFLQNSLSLTSGSFFFAHSFLRNSTIFHSIRLFSGAFFRKFPESLGFADHLLKSFRIFRNLLSLSLSRPKARNLAKSRLKVETLLCKFLKILRGFF